MCPASWGSASALPPDSRQQALNNLPSCPPRGCVQPMTHSFIPVQNKVYSCFQTLLKMFSCDNGVVLRQEMSLVLEMVQ